MIVIWHFFEQAEDVEKGGKSIEDNRRTSELRIVLCRQIV
jgi:hypothetical protein